MTAPVLLSGFADEAANEKQAVQQYSAFAALGLKYYSIRFVDAGEGIKNVMQLSDPEIQHLVKMQGDYGLKVSSIGSPIGKVKLQDVDDGTANKYIRSEERRVGKECRARWGRGLSRKRRKSVTRIK